MNTWNYLGYSDWRLPNVNELESLVNIGQENTAPWLNAQGFINVLDDKYWSSSPYANTIFAWASLWRGIVASRRIGAKSNTYYAWPVRSRQPAPANLPQTGQTTCYDTDGTVISCAGTGQDGELKKGVAWPSPRFTNPDGSVPISENLVVDQLTGLVWTRDGNAPGPATCSPGVTKTWQDALNYAACLNKWNYLGYSDWRLPNRKEFRSLVNYEQIHPGTWLNAQGFIDVQAAFYWSSTSSNADNNMDAWLPELWSGMVNVGTKTGKHYAWPVHSGQ